MFSSIKNHFYAFVSVFALVAVVASLFTFVSPVYASNPPGTTYQYLMATFKSEHSQLLVELANLKNAQSEQPKFEALLDTIVAAGEDPTALLMAGETFESQMETAKSALDMAHTVLVSHRGFDADGNITDIYAAGLTVSQARTNLNDCQNTLSTAISNINRSVNSWLITNKAINDWLKSSYIHDQNWLTAQQNDLNNQAGVASKLQKTITYENGKSKDTTALVAALATFQSQVAAAQTPHTAAAGIFSTHVGFDAHGNVTNQNDARTTITAANQALGTASTLLQQATTALNKAIAAWNKSH